MALDTWFHVSFNNDYILIEVNPPSSDGWEAQIEWIKILRICFQPADFLASDDIYIFTSEREESYVIPTEADGGLEIWNEIIRRNYFDAALAIKAASSVSGLYCWPQEE